MAGERRRSVSLKGPTTSNSSNVTKTGATTSQYVVGMCQTEGDLDECASRFILTNDGILAKLFADDNDDNNNSKSNGQVLWMSNLDGLCENPGGEWFHLSYVDAADELSLVCLSRNGAIATVHPTTGEAELVGEFEHGLQAASFSPDGEVLCLLTFSEDDDDDGQNEQDATTASTEDASPNSSALLLMNTQWEVLAEANIDNHIPSDTSTESKVSICWRPDGSLVALSTVDAADNLRKIRIYKRDNLEFSAIGRTEDGSGKLVPNMIASAGVSWAGAGCSQLLAAAQRKGKKTIQVIFYEPNGNRHREFVLREEPSTEVVGLAWNVESDLLAVTLRETFEGGSDKVQLWHRSNYHWYMKQEFRYTGRQVSRVAFHDEKPGLLYVFFQGTMEWREYEVLWQPCTMQLLAPKTCAAYVVDGSSLNMTPLDQAMVPPPMFLSTLVMESPITQILLSNDDKKSVTAVVRLSDASIVLIGNPLKQTGNRTRFATPAIVAKGSLNSVDGMDCSGLRSFVILEHTDSSIRLLAACCAADNDTCESLVILNATWNEDEQTLSISKHQDVVTLEQRVLCIAQWSDTMSGAILETEDGKVWDVDTAGDGTCILLPLSSQELMEPCPWIAGIKDPSSFADSANSNPYDNDPEQKRLVFGLSQRSRLFYHDMLLADAVSSFFVSVSHQYLCYVSAQGSTSQLRFLPLRDLQSFDTLMGSDGNTLLEGYEPRSVERGARLVAILPGSPAAVLQVPRGNLEGIFPRALVLRFVMTKIAAGNYDDAFAMMRTQKVNLNLIVDLNPTKFLEDGLLLLLKQVTIMDHLNLFISCLQNWDSTQMQYRIPHWLSLVSEYDLEAKKFFNFSGKVNEVCARLRTLMLQSERDGKLDGGRIVAEGDFLLPILTTFAKEDPPKLEEALTLIKENAIAKSKQSKASVKKPPLFSEAAQSSIQYLAFLADHELIFNVGLGLYDFDIARACARNSQMDPKVYLPLLKRLKTLPPYYGRYEVDMRLKRFENALRTLFESGQHNESLDGIEPVKLNDLDTMLRVGNDFEQCMNLIEDHKLHSVGLQLYKTDPGKKRLIMLSLGEYLLKDSKAGGALTVFLAAEPVDIEQAKRAARACKDWKCFFTLSCQGEEQDEESKALRESAAREISEGIALTSENQYSCQSDFGDAARMLLDYCNDVDATVEMLTKGWLWQEGCRVATLNGRTELVQTCIDAAVIFAEMIQGDMEERKSAFEEANFKYEEALERRKEAIRNGGEIEDQHMAAETGSLFSAASNVSNMSLQSTASTDSLSSVISIKSANSFSISGSEVDSRHKSKFNPMGGKKKKKKKKGKKNRIQPGSPAELKNAVDALRGNCVDEDLSKVISQTIKFLSQTGGELAQAKAVFNSYVDLSDAIQQSHATRTEARRSAQLAELHKVPVHLPAEDDVSSLSCPKLLDSLYEVFVILKDN